LANFYLRKTPTTYSINKHLVIDYSLTSGSVQQPDYSESDHKGAFVWNTPQLSCSITPAPLPDDPSNSPLTFIISESMGDCIGWLLFKMQILGGFLTPNMVPPNSPIQLNTSNSNMKRILPGLYAMYPNKAINVILKSTAAPDVIISSEIPLVKVAMQGSAEIYVVNSTELAPAFLMDLDLLLEATVGFNAGNVTANLVSVAFNSTLVQRWIGDINMHSVDELVKVFINLGIQPQVNKITQVGFPIPRIQGVQFLNSEVEYGNGYLKVGSDFSYHPEAATQFMPHMTPNVITVN